MLRVAQELALEWVKVRFFDIGTLPFLNEDLEATGSPRRSPASRKIFVRQCAPAPFHLPPAHRHHRECVAQAGQGRPLVHSPRLPRGQPPELQHYIPRTCSNPSCMNCWFLPGIELLDKQFSFMTLCCRCFALWQASASLFEKLNRVRQHGTGSPAAVADFFL